ncbi:Trp biosynthesis-associated membrane protein [Kribbella sp. NPDC023855]|uniref:Trp biosynthesis-associated membrane protein n=1 Tax=Kribbella sp. NPDC023855 TaxID=3154698 RepID=UPI0033E1B370
MRPQRLVDLLALVALVLLGVSAYLTWSSVDVGSGPTVDFQGKDLTSAPIVLAAAAVAAVVITKLGGTALRRVMSALLLLIGGVVVAVALQVRPGLDELSRLKPGLTHNANTDSFEILTGPAPWLALAGGLAVVAAGLIGLLTAHRWKRPTRRYERDPAATPADQWKAIDAGEDPTI